METLRKDRVSLMDLQNQASVKNYLFMFHSFIHSSHLLGHLSPGWGDSRQFTGLKQNKTKSAINYELKIKR